MKLVTAVIVVSAVLAGCAQPIRVPVDVSMVPNDCANQQRIISWLTELSQKPRQYGERVEDYEYAKSQINAKIGRLRYHCQPVR